MSVVFNLIYFIYSKYKKSKRNLLVMYGLFFKDQHFGAYYTLEVI